MGIFDLFSRSAPAQRVEPRVMADVGTFFGLNDPTLPDFLRGGSMTTSGETVSIDMALRNTALFRAVTLISRSIGMLPVHLIRNQADGQKVKADDHPLYAVLHREPNVFQSAFEFRSLIQLRALIKGNGYALIVRSKDLRTGRPKITQMVPLDPDRVTPQQNADWTLSYRYNPATGGGVTYAAQDIFHLRGDTLDGINGLSLVKMASEAIGLARGAERAAGRLFKNGAILGGAIEMAKDQKALSDVAFQRLKQELEERYTGADNAHKWLILEEGAQAKTFAPTAEETQLVESRSHQIEEIARVTGVPRPLLMIDDTSWGRGIEALGRFFVTYALNPWFEAWQQALERAALAPDEKGVLEVKFNAGALLRGSMLDQSKFFSAALGAGGGAPWITPNEARDFMDLNKIDGGDELPARAATGSKSPSDEGDDDPPADSGKIDGKTT